MPSEETNAPRGEATRQAILNAAEQLFLVQGYNGTSMRQIAEGAGDIAVGGIYNHYKSKQEIFRALLEARSPYPQVIEILDSIQEGTGPEMLAAAFRAMSSLMQQHYGFIRLVAIDIQEHNSDTVIALISTLLPHAFPFFLRTQSAGGLRKDIPVYVLARTFISLLFGYNLTNFVLFEGENLRLNVPLFVPLSQDKWLEYITDIFINGISTQGDDQD